MSRESNLTDEQVLALIEQLDRENAKLRVVDVAAAAKCQTKRAGELLQQYLRKKGDARGLSDVELEMQLLERFGTIVSIAQSHAENRVRVVQQAHATVMEATERKLVMLETINTEKEATVEGLRGDLRKVGAQLAVALDNGARLEQALALEQSETRRLKDELLRATQALAQARNQDRDGIAAKLDSIVERLPRRKPKP